METKVCRFCGESHIPIYEDICKSCEEFLNTTSRNRPVNPFDLNAPLDDSDDEEGGHENS